MARIRTPHFTSGQLTASVRLIRTRVHCYFLWRQYQVLLFLFSARLDASKLRKFADCYLEFYNKAKNHKKLMMSIMMAE